MKRLIIATVVLLICSIKFKAINGLRSPSEFSIPRERKILGKGSFGMVEVAIDTKNGQQCALKHMDPNDRSTGLEIKVAMQVEQMTVSLGTCPYMVQTLAFDVEPRILSRGQTEIQTVMELVDGGELYGFMLNHKPLPEPLVKLFTIQLVLAIGCLHDRGILWLDGKPENVLLILNEHGEQSGRLKIADFGLSEIVDPGYPFTKSQAGTPYYRCPEVSVRKERGYASDWWTLGVMVYEMFAGRVPFIAGSNEGPGFVKNLIRYYEGKKDYRLQFPVSFPKGAKDLVTKLLTRSPETRFGVLRDGYISDADGLLNHPWLSSGGVRKNGVKIKLQDAVKDPTFDFSAFVAKQLKLTHDSHIEKDKVDKMKAERDRQQAKEAKKAEDYAWKRDEELKRGNDGERGQKRFRRLSSCYK